MPVSIICIGIFFENPINGLLKPKYQSIALSGREGYLHIPAMLQRESKCNKTIDGTHDSKCFLILIFVSNF